MKNKRSKGFSNKKLLSLQHQANNLLTELSIQELKGVKGSQRPLPSETSKYSEISIKYNDLSVLSNFDAFIFYNFAKNNAINYH